MAGRARNEPLAWAGVAQEVKALRGQTGKWVEVWTKPEGETWAKGRDGEVLAAMVQRGLGRVGEIVVTEGAAAAELRKRMIEYVLAPAGDRRFRITTDRQEGGWHVRVEGADEKGFLDGEELWMIAGDSRQRLAQTGPGRYEGAAATPEALLAMVVRKRNEAEMLVGRVRTAAVETGEWPASVQDELRGVTELPAGGAERWAARGAEVATLAAGCWVMGIGLGLLAMALRR
jgi:hypothetical protein